MLLDIELILKFGGVSVLFEVLKLFVLDVVLIIDLLDSFVVGDFIVYCFVE